MKYIVDTNILLGHPKVFEQKNLVITLRSLEEIDHLKINRTQEVAYEARRASRYIYQHKEDIEFITKTNAALSVDNDIIYWAKKLGYGVISNDINILIKCYMKDILCTSYRKDGDYYSGVLTVEAETDGCLGNLDIDKIVNSCEAPIRLKENQYLIIKDVRSQNVYCIMRQTEGKLVVLDKNYYITNPWVRRISPRNPEQECLFNLLFNDEIKIVLAKGKYGSGKTMCLANYALQQLDLNQIDKIIWVPNNAYSQDSRELGLLPGNKFEKEIPFLGSLIDIVGENDALTLVEQEKLEIIPISIMRGRNFSRSIVIVNEAQNLTEEHVKLLVGRCASGTRIFFDGDIKQADNQVFKNKNGLALLLKLADSPIFSKIFGTVTLTKIERSFTAQASDYLDSLS